MVAVRLVVVVQAVRGRTRRRRVTLHQAIHRPTRHRAALGVANERGHATRSRAINRAIHWRLADADLCVLLARRLRRLAWHYRSGVPRRIGDLKNGSAISNEMGSRASLQ